MKWFALLGMMLFLGVEVAPSINADEKGKPDLKILEMAIDYDHWVHLPVYYMVIKCKVQNIGNASVTYLGVHGTAERVYCKFLSEGDLSSGSTPSWEPGKVKWITTVAFPPYEHFKFVDYGLYQINIRVSTPDDANPENNIIDGQYLIFNGKVIPRI